MSRVQDHIAQFIKPLLQSPIVDGVLLPAISLKAGENTVPHTLQRQPLGWLLVDSSATTTVHRVSWDTYNLVLSASAPVTVALWVF